MAETNKGINTPAAVLWASAFGLAALVVVQAGKLPGNQAYADQGVQGGGFTLLTTDSGRGDDASPDELLYVLDSRSEFLLVYEIPNARQQQMILRQGANLPVWFANARR